MSLAESGRRNIDPRKPAYEQGAPYVWTACCTANPLQTHWPVYPQRQASCRRQSRCLRSKHSYGRALLLPCAALATEMPEPDVATPITCDEVNAEGSLTATTVDHYYDLELPPAFELVQNEALVYDFPDKPEDFIYGLNDTVHLFKIDTDTESLIKTENPKEASVSIALTMIDNHVRATVVFTGSYADDQIPYRLNLNSSTYLGTHVDRNFDSGQGIMHETRHDYYIRYVFDSDVHLFATDTSGSKPEPETKPEPTPQPKAKKPTASPVSTKAVAAVKPAGATLPATGDNGAMAAALSVAGAVVAAVGISATRRRNR